MGVMPGKYEIEVRFEVEAWSPMEARELVEAAVESVINPYMRMYYVTYRTTQREPS